jgi:murein DD-endopeptidase MepM/ murein hydrolase activator NlpD
MNNTVKNIGKDPYELRFEIELLDGTLGEIKDLQNTEYFLSKRKKLLNEYRSIIGSRHRSVPFDERQYIGAQLLAEARHESRVRGMRIAAEASEATRRTRRGSAWRAARNIAAVVAVAFNTSALYDGRGSARGSEIDTLLAPVEIAPIYASAPSSAQVAEKFRSGFWDTYPALDVEKRLTSLAGKRSLPSHVKGNKVHAGIDLHAPAGTVVVAPAEGVLEDIYSSGLSVNTGSYTYTKRHILPRKGLENGMAVSAGDTLGVTAPAKYLEKGVHPHLHIEVRGNEGIFSLAAESNINPLVMFESSIYQEMVLNLEKHEAERKPVPSGFRYLAGSSVREKLDRSLEEQVLALANARLEPIVVSARRLAE